LQHQKITYKNYVMTKISLALLTGLKKVILTMKVKHL